MDFPKVDPIPIPAPVWLMKALELLTVSLHFVAVQILIGSLLMVIYLSWRGKSGKSSAHLSAANVLARRLPVIMTYVINLGVPPLLFTQVLYGRALYTSSDLIAVFWLSVILLVMGIYWHLYRIAERASEGRSVVIPGIVALVLASGVGQIYSINMTLMLRPEVWKQMYASTAGGLQVAPHDPTMMPRWLFVMVGGLLIGGLWMLLHSGLKTIDEGAQGVLRKMGAMLAALGAVAQLGIGFMVYSTQPANVQEGLGGIVYKASGVLWAVGLVLVLALVLPQIGRKTVSTGMSAAAGVAAFLSVAGSVIVRDGIRDITLKAKGLDVWNRVEDSNWFVIGLFLLLFVVGLGILFWLLQVLRQAKPIQESVNA